MKKIILTLLILFYSGWCYAADYYAAPSVQGSGDCSSAANACLINTAWSSMAAGDTLWLADGTYTGANSMIIPPNTLDGSSGNPITVKATNHGEVFINGQDTNIPIHLSADWFIVEGINAYNSSAECIHVISTNCIIRKVIAWDASTTIFLSNGATNTLFEDCAGWGVGRKVFAVLSDASTTFRRCFFMWSGYVGASTWRVGLTHGYYSSNTIVENCIGTWDRVFGLASGEDYAIFGGDGGGATGTVKSYGNIAFHLSTTQTGPLVAMFAGTKANHVFDVKDVAVYTDANKEGIDLCPHTGSATGDYLTSITGGTNDYLCGTNGTNKLTDPTIGTLGGDICQYTSTSRPATGAWIRNRYVGGVLTGDALWPWPMNDRIASALVASGYDASGIDGNGNTDLTNAVFTLYGGTEPVWEDPPPASPSIGKFTGAGNFR
jgi:hypothetical protein